MCIQDRLLFPVVRDEICGFELNLERWNQFCKWMMFLDLFLWVYSSLIAPMQNLVILSWKVAMKYIEYEFSLSYTDAVWVKYRMKWLDLFSHFRKSPYISKEFLAKLHINWLMSQRNKYYSQYFLFWWSMKYEDLSSALLKMHGKMFIFLVDPIFFMWRGNQNSFQRSTNKQNQPWHWHHI